MFFPYNQVHTIYEGQASNSGPSARIWDKIKSAGISPDGFASGRYYGDDFAGFGIGTAVAANVGYYVSDGGTYKSFEDTGGAVAGTPGTGGLVLLSVDADDNQEAWIQYGSGGGTIGDITAVAGSERVVAFEARFKTSTLVGNLFIGLAEEAFAADSALSDVGALSDKDQIGFHVIEGAASTLTFVYKKAGQTAVTVIASAATLVADTFIKVGFLYDPAADAAKRIKVFVNGVELTTYVTGTMMAAATFPDAQQLTFVAGCKNVTDIKTMTVDWWHYWRQIG